jgi:hypothetical protein
METIVITIGTGKYDDAAIHNQSGYKSEDHSAESRVNR